MSKNVVLTGMMGVGKSTVAKILANKLAFNFIDIDSLIEKQEGSSINLIFKNKSENYFRMIENKISLRELKKQNLVISLGGGAFMNNEIRKEVKNSSISFWLDVNTNILAQRLKKTRKRPLLFNKNLNEAINKIYMSRKKTYNQADFRIKCDSLKPEMIAEKIFKIYENSEN